MVKIKITATAKKDIRQIFDYISKHSLQNAILLNQALYTRINVLYKSPECGQIVKEINDPLIRGLKLYKFRIIYKVENEEVFIITIHHSSRQLHNNPHLKGLFE